MAEKNNIVTIDGPSGAGKSTISKLLAARLHYTYLDTGAMYRVVGLQGGELKIALTAPPVEGAANKACGDFLARLFNLPKRCVRLISGDTSRHKRWLLEGCDAREVSRLLNEQLGG